MSLAYRASTSANPDPMISPTFVEANYEVLESLLRERRRQMDNEELHTELEYFSEEYDEERKIEPKAERVRETTPVLHTYSLRVWRQRKSVVEFEDAPNRDGGRVERNSKGHQPLVNTGGNLPPNGAHLSYNDQPFIPNNLQPPSGPIPTYDNPNPQPEYGSSLWTAFKGYALQAPTSNNNLTSNGFMYSSAAPLNNYPFYTQPMYPLPNTPAYPNHGPTGLFTDSTGCVTPFVCWIKDYPLPDGLKMPSYVGSYDGKADPNNYLHLFKGAIRMQK
ncbi:hypothetical protein Tco_1315924 [Tanacetum coccineum]